MFERILDRADIITLTTTNVNTSTVWKLREKTWKCSQKYLVAELSNPQQLQNPSGEVLGEWCGMCLQISGL